ncbi:chymotrypsin BI-like [Schistocerca americana]|uniref:chymotrypsin BI-like n=1 Tax=Schistocerca americana TaxID=7009 RepID=UPI001F5003B2|nr:chymotrypsin BI-like [Schistocerca americana]
MKVLLVCLMFVAAAVQAVPAGGLPRLPERRSDVRALRPKGALLQPRQHSEEDDADSAGKQPRIIYGKQAEEGQFPWMASLRLDYVAFCGGSLIIQQCVLTAGHCADGSVPRLHLHLGLYLCSDPLQQSLKSTTPEDILAFL